jgi:hypothetical protein
LFSRLSKFPHPAAGRWAGRGGEGGDPAPDAWVLAGRSRKDLAWLGKGRRWGGGCRWLNPTFFSLSISPTSSPVVGEV